MGVQKWHCLMHSKEKWHVKKDISRRGALAARRELTAILRVAAPDRERDGVGRRDDYSLRLQLASAILKFMCFHKHPPKCLRRFMMGNHHPSPNVKNLCTFEPQIWLEIITSRDAQSACFKGSQTSCTELISGVFWPRFGRKKSHHVMDAAC